MSQNLCRASHDFLIKSMPVGSRDGYYNCLVHPVASHNTSLIFAMSSFLLSQAYPLFNFELWGTFNSVPSCPKNCFYPCNIVPHFL